MRTTIDLPADLHRMTKALARDMGQTFSETIVLLLRRALGQGPTLALVERSHSTGLPSVRLGTTITSEDVRELEDDL